MKIVADSMDICAFRTFVYRLTGAIWMSLVQSTKYTNCHYGSKGVLLFMPHEMNRSRLTYNNFYYYLLLIVPLMIVYIVFFVIPIGQSIFYSFTNFNGLNPVADWVGIKNYIVAVKDKYFQQAIKNTVLLAVGITIVQNVLGMMFALMLNRKFHGRGLMRTLVFAPCMIAQVIAAYLWQFIFSPDGLINSMFGLEKIWLADENLALICILISYVWAWIGYTATIYIANLQSISHEIIEASQIDGCNGWKRFWKVIFPMMAPSVTVNVSLALTGSLKIFDLVYAMTNGGPNGATETMGTYVMKKMSLNLHGYACACTVIMTLLIIVLGQALTQFLQKRERMINE